MTMRVTYYALRRIQVGDSFREPGELVPEAATWKYLSGYVNDAKIAPVLVVTLPQEVQDMLAAWEDAQNSPPAAVEPELEPDENSSETDEVDADEDEDEDSDETEEVKEEPQPSGRKKAR